jgi:hypothetical protein
LSNFGLALVIRFERTGLRRRAVRGSSGIETSHPSGLTVCAFAAGRGGFVDGGSQQVRADELAAALASERLRRDLPRSRELAAPDETLWRAGYRTVDADVPGIAEKTLVDALPLAKRFSTWYARQGFRATPAQ